MSIIPVPEKLISSVPAHIHARRLPDSIPTKDILPITLRVGDGNAQPDNQIEQDAIWSSNQHITTYGQRLA